MEGGREQGWLERGEWRLEGWLNETQSLMFHRELSEGPAGEGVMV